MMTKIFKKLTAASIAALTLVTLAPIGASAEWIENDNGNWSYIDWHGYATDGWKLINGAWYYFNSDGQMRTGWILDNGEWYYMGLDGAMETGVIQIEGKIYLFSLTGAMQKGSNVINGRLYNFDDNGSCMGPSYPVPAKGFDYYGNSTTPYVPTQIISGNETMSSDVPSDSSNPVKQYKVVFKDPDADDDDEEVLKTRTVPEDTKMPLYKPTKSGYDFIEWNTHSDGDGTSYEYDDSITITKNITLYAQWEESSGDDTNTGDTIKVTKIVVSGSNNINEIKTKSGSLQMTKIITPSDADNQSVKWTVINGANNSSGQASISATGKLTAMANGTVTVRATATDGSNVYGEINVNISGQ